MGMFYRFQDALLVLFFSPYMIHAQCTIHYSLPIEYYIGMRSTRFCLNVTTRTQNRKNSNIGLCQVTKHTDAAMQAWNK